MVLVCVFSAGVWKCSSQNQAKFTHLRNPACAPQRTWSAHNAAASHQRTHAEVWTWPLGTSTTSERTHNYKHVPPVMTVCVMGDINIGAVISQALKLAMTRSRMLFLPKQRGRHLLALPRHSQSMSKVPSLFDTAVCCYWIRSREEEMRRSEMSESVFTIEAHQLFVLLDKHKIPHRHVLKFSLKNSLCDMIFAQISQLYL